MICLYAGNLHLTLYSQFFKYSITYVCACNKHNGIIWIQEDYKLMVNKIAKPDVYSLKQTNESFAALTKCVWATWKSWYAQCPCVWLKFEFTLVQKAHVRSNNSVSEDYQRNHFLSSRQEFGNILILNFVTLSGTHPMA